jgi:polyhydroxyalkanoate synthesis regulator phasin
MVVKDFKRFINDTFKEKEQLRKFFLNHERLPLLIDNLTREILKCDADFKTKLSRKKIRELVCDCTRMFCRTAINVKEEEIKTLHQKVIDEFGNKIEDPLGPEPELPEGVISIDRGQ